jgi:Flp pilus assembly pilin Flp
MIDRIVVWALTLKARVSEERGQDLVEYALITGGIGLALIAVTIAFRGAVATWFGDAATAFATITP